MMEEAIFLWVNIFLFLLFFALRVKIVVDRFVAFCSSTYCIQKLIHQMQIISRTCCVIFLFSWQVKAVAQQKDLHLTDTAIDTKKTSTIRQASSDDPYRIDYREVYDNMHYNQPLRPQVHYTPITGQIADATGLIRYKGKFHLFYMFDEWSKQRRDNKNWGHAVSEDCIYWDQKPPITNSIIDNRPGSGSGIIDWNNTLGLRTSVEKTMVVFYTDYGRGVSIAFSNDAGETWFRHKRNPVLPGKEGTRDPNVFWYKPDQSWRMVIYEQPGFSFYKSDNLLDWKFLSKMDGFFECPDLMQIPVDGKTENKKWVLIDGNGCLLHRKFLTARNLYPIQRKLLWGRKPFLIIQGACPIIIPGIFTLHKHGKIHMKAMGRFINWLL
jgi:sucrose-6-phosphate hydrolase SacC (GH32 family)